MTDNRNRERRPRQARRAAGCLLLTGTLLLTGCTARELEERRFPLALEFQASGDTLSFICAWPYTETGTEEKTDKSSLGEKALPEDFNNDSLTRVSAASMEEALEAMQDLQDKYVDYSQVKAVLLGKTLREKTGLRRQVFRWLEQTPEIARNVLIFEADDLNLEEVQSRAQGQPGAYLENLYKNNGKYREMAGTLKEILYR